MYSLDKKYLNKKKKTHGDQNNHSTTFKYIQCLAWPFTITALHRVQQNYIPHFKLCGESDSFI